MNWTKQRDELTENFPEYLYHFLSLIRKNIVHPIQEQILLPMLLFQLQKLEITLKISQLFKNTNFIYTDHSFLLEPWHVLGVSFVR